MEEFDGTFTLSLCDFERSMEIYEDMHELDNGFAAVTTMGYCAPECFEGKRGLSSDIYSFGLLAWELFVGKPVNFGMSLPQIMITVIYKFEVISQQMLDLLTPEHPLREFFCLCWSKDDTKRPSAQAALEYLENIQPNNTRLPPVTAPPPHTLLWKPDVLSQVIGWMP